MAAPGRERVKRGATFSACCVESCRVVYAETEKWTARACHHFREFTEQTEWIALNKENECTTYGTLTSRTARISNGCRFFFNFALGSQRWVMKSGWVSSPLEPFPVESKTSFLVKKKGCFCSPLRALVERISMRNIALAISEDTEIRMHVKAMHLYALCTSHVFFSSSPFLSFSSDRANFTFRTCRFH